MLIKTESFWIMSEDLHANVFTILFIILFTIFAIFVHYFPCPYLLDYDDARNQKE